MTQEKPITAIHDWHAHIYFTPETRETAEQLRRRLVVHFPDALFGRWHERPVGPHAQPMYQVLFAPADFAAMLPFIALNRGPLSVLIHPNTHRERDDHSHHAIWLGPQLPVDLSILPEGPAT